MPPAWTGRTWHIMAGLPYRVRGMRLRCRLQPAAGSTRPPQPGWDHRVGRPGCSRPETRRRVDGTCDGSFAEYFAPAPPCLPQPTNVPFQTRPRSRLGSPPCRPCGPPVQTARRYWSSSVWTALCRADCQSVRRRSHGRMQHAQGQLVRSLGATTSSTPSEDFADSEKPL